MKRNVKTNFVKAVAIVGIVGFASGIYVAGSDLLVHEVSASSTEISNADATITFDDSDVTGKGTGYEISDDTVTINEAGTYVLQGDGENVQVKVDAKDQNVILILNGVSLINETDAPIYIKKANNATIVLAENTVNTLSDSVAAEEITEENEREANAVIYSSSDLIINGTGKLVVNGCYKNGITSKDNLVINSGDFEINTANNGIIGKDSLTVVNGDFKVTSGGDGFQSDNTDIDKGFVTIEDGNFNITSANDAIQAESTLTINNGKFNINTNGGAISNTTVHEDSKGGGKSTGTAPTGTTVTDSGKPPEIPGEMQFGADGRPTGTVATTDGKTTASTDTSGTKTGNQPPEIPGEMKFDENGKPVGTPSGDITNNTTNNTTATAETLSDSYKGLKASTIVINNGNFVIDSNDDAVHSNGNITINNGVFTISSGDDAIHAENNLTINDGEIDVLTTYEGLEAFKIEINAGVIDVVATDDALNATSATSSGFGGGEMGGTTYNEETDPAICINGGTLTLDSKGDTLDSNGVLFVNGGDIKITGPSSGVEISMDFNKYAEVDGGEYIALGGSSNMFSNFATSSDQVSFAYFFTSQQSADSTLEVLDSKGSIVVSIVPTRAYTSVVVSSPALVKGETYTLKTAYTTETITLSSTDTVTTLGYTGTQSGGGRGMGNKVAGTTSTALDTNPASKTVEPTTNINSL